MFSNLPPLHPAIVHFPIALLLLAGVFAFLSLFFKREFWKGLAVKSLFVGVIFFPLAVITGLIEEQNLEHNEAVHEILLIHKYIGISLLFFYQALLVWYWLRRKLIGDKEYIAWVLGLLLGAALIGYQGFLGGEMVFEYGAGVKSTNTEMKSSGGHDHGGGKMEMKDSSATKDEHDLSAPHHDSSMKGMDMNEMQDRDDMKGMDSMKNMKGMDNMKGMKGMDGMKDMKGMDNIKGKDNMKGMKGMDNMKGTDGMKGNDNMKGMKGMDGMKGTDGMKDMKGMDNIKDMKGNGTMNDMKGMEMPGMNMPTNQMDKFRFKDNNPARQKPIEKKQ